MVVVLGLNDCKRNVGLVEVDGVGLLRLGLGCCVAENDDPTSGEVAHLQHVGHHVPLRPALPGDGRGEDFVRMSASVKAFLSG